MYNSILKKLKEKDNIFSEDKIKLSKTQNRSWISKGISDVVQKNNISRCMNNWKN